MVIPHILPVLMASPQGGGASPWGTMIMFGAIFAIFYFLLIRPQRKQQKDHEAMVAALEKGDKVVTLGGIIGRILHIEDDRVTIKTAEDTRIEVERSKVGRKLGE
jgi:preprotein translocase subunit YajC